MTPKERELWNFQTMCRKILEDPTPLNGEVPTEVCIPLEQAQRLVRNAMGGMASDSFLREDMGIILKELSDLKREVAHLKTMVAENPQINAETSV